MSIEIKGAQKSNYYQTFSSILEVVFPQPVQTMANRLSVDASPSKNGSSSIAIGQKTVYQLPFCQACGKFHFDVKCLIV